MYLIVAFPENGHYMHYFSDYNNYCLVQATLTLLSEGTCTILVPGLFPVKLLLEVATK